MRRFVALVWNPEDEIAVHTAAKFIATYRDDTPEWRCALNLPGLTVFVAGPVEPAPGIHVLARSGGVVVGTLFGKVDEREAAQILATGGRWLFEHCWGRYIALLREGTRGRCHVLRDPSGMMPCYRLRNAGCDVVFADLADVARIGGPRRSINWRFITAYLLHDELRSRETGYQGVSEVLAGERLTMTTDGDERLMMWGPAEVCGRGFVENFEEAEGLLQSTTQKVIEAWGRRYPRVLHHLSGGFDSAVVLGCAQRAGLVPSMTCVNRFSTRPGEDERPFSRLAAAQAGVDLIECEWGIGGEGLERLRSVPLLPKPSVQMLSILESTTLNELARRCHAEVQWTGQGGDQLFFQMKTDLCAADYLRAHGLSGGWLAAVEDAARLTRESYCTVLGSTIRSGLLRRRWRAQQPTLNPPFLSSDAVATVTAEYVEHPWSVGASDLPAGKQYQVGVLANLVNRANPVCALEGVPEIHPLISRPLMELSLRIPTYILLKGGRSRALARAAFRDVVPSEICSRDEKGGTTVHLTTLLRRNLRFMREVLVEGTLVRERLIDRKRLEPYLLKGHPLRAGELSPLLACLTAEVWLMRAGSPGLGDGERDEASEGAGVGGIESDRVLRPGG